jgi:DNA-binding response OmpR family regulator
MLAIDRQTFSMKDIDTGEVIELSKTEWLIVAVLARFSPAVVRNEVLALHTYTGEPPLNTMYLLKWHIVNIRRKLGREAIITRAGFGYRLGATIDPSGVQEGHKETWRLVL